MNAEVIRNEHTIVRADGEIDYSNVEGFRKALDEASEHAPDGFIVDLSEAAYIDSAGVQAILSAYTRIRPRDGRIALVTGSGVIGLVLEAVHLEMLPGMSVCKDRQEAVTSLGTKDA